MIPIIPRLQVAPYSGFRHALPRRLARILSGPTRGLARQDRSRRHILAGDGQGEAILVWPLARGQESPEQMATRVAQVLAGPDRSFQIWIKSGDSQEANAAANLERPGGALERSQRSRWR